MSRQAGMSRMPHLPPLLSLTVPAIVACHGAFKYDAVPRTGSFFVW